MPPAAHERPTDPEARKPETRRSQEGRKEVAMLVTMTSLLLLAAIALGLQGARPAREWAPVRVRIR